MKKFLHWLAKMKIKIVEANIKPDQLGVNNVQVDIQTVNQTYNFNFNFSTAEAAKTFAETVITPEMEEMIKVMVQGQLAPIAPVIDLMSESSSLELVATTTAATTVSFIKKL